MAVHRWGAGVEHLGVTEWRAYCRDRAAFERVRETAVSRADPGTAFIFAPASVAFSSPSVLPDAFALGTRLFEEGYVNNAIVALETEVRRHPMSADAWALMGKAHAENDQDGEAIACLKIANALNPNDREVLVNLGISQVNELSGAKACLYFAQWLRLSPYSSVLPQDLEKEIAKQAQEDTPSASASALLNWQESWDQSDSNRPDVRVLLIEVLKSALEINPNDADLCIITGALYTACYLFSLAINYFEAALRTNPSDYALWNKLGATHANNQSPRLAVRAYTKALALRPDYVRCLANVGIAHHAAGRSRFALHFWARTFMLNPNSGVWNYMWMADPSLGRDKDPNRVSAYLMEGDVPVEFGENDADADAAARPDRTTDFLDEWASSRDREAMLRANLQRGEGSGIDFADDVPWDDELSAALLRDAAEGLPRTMTEEEEEHDEKKEKEKEIETEKESSTKKKYSMQELMELIAEGKTPEDVRQIDDKPPNPDALVNKGDRQRPLKPWERAAAAAPPPAVVLSASGSTSTTASHAHPTTATATSPSSGAATAATTGSAPKKATNAGLSIYTVDSFTKEAFAGNPAAVCLVPPSVELSETTMKRIAREMNLSETAFVQPFPGVPNKYRLRWFTPTTEVHLCGHATLATAHVLFTEVGATAPALTFSTLSGDLVVEKADAAADADPKSPLLRMDFPQGKPQPTRLSDHLLAQTLAALGLADADLVWREPAADADAAVRAPVTLVCPVTKKLFVEIVSVDKLVSLKPNADALLALPFEAAGLPVRGVCVMVQGGRDDRSRRPGLNLAFYTDMSYVPDHVPYDFVTRYFAPWNGIYEDPVNGSSHTALAVIWSQELGKERLRSFQASARTGELEVALAPNDRTLIFGHAVTVMGGRLRV